MGDQELELLLRGAESDRVERKRQLKHAKEDVAKAICAFANDLPNHGRPGIVFIGVEDDGVCANLPITDELLLELGGFRAEGNILPMPSMTVQKRILNHCEVAVIEVSPSSDTPVRYNGIEYVRVGPRKGIANAEDQRILVEKRRAGNAPFDMRSIPDSGESDLDLDLFDRTYLPASVAREVLDQNERTREQKLRSLRLLSPRGTETTVAGMLTIGKDPTAFLPGAYIQFLRIEGKELNDPLRDEKRIGGPLPEMLRQLDEVLQLNISTRVVPTGAVETRSPDYPIEALRQMVRNAVMHRSYEGTNAPIRVYWFSDRVEIHSPGGPYGQVTVANFGTPGITDYRNPHIAEAMKNLGYVQKFGMGFQIANAQLKQNGNPPLEKDVQQNFVLIVLRRAA